MSKTTVTVNNNNTAIEPGSKTVDVVTQGIQGPAGPAGADGSGTVISSETPPSNPTNGQIWIKPSTEESSIWTNGEWRIFVYEDELAADDGLLYINAGYF